MILYCFKHCRGVYLKIQKRICLMTLKNISILFRKVTHYCARCYFTILQNLNMTYYIIHTSIAITSLNSFDVHYNDLGTDNVIHGKL